MGMMNNLKKKIKDIDFQKVKDFINECCEEDRKRAMRVEKNGTQTNRNK